MTNSQKPIPIIRIIPSRWGPTEYKRNIATQERTQKLPDVMAEGTDAPLINPAEAATDEEFEELWDQLLREPRRPRAVLTLRDIAPAPPAAPPAGPTARPRARMQNRVPKVGTIIQRSSATNARKLKALLQVPPRPPPRGKATKPLPTAAQKKTLQSLFGDLADLSDDEAPTGSDTPPKVRQPSPKPARLHPQRPPAQPENEPPAPQPGTPRTKGACAATSTLEADGPGGPPPVRVLVGGTPVDVPYFSAIITRKFRACIGNRKFVLRFNNRGECVFQREL